MIGRMTSAAKTVIDAFGGAAAAARALEVDLSRIYRWTYPSSRGGTGGAVPQRHHRRILELARKRGLALSAADLIGPGVADSRPEAER